MGKIKKLLMGALACVGVLGCAAVVGSKVEAATTTYTATLTGTGTVISKDSSNNEGPTFKCNGDKSITVTATSIITGQEKKYTKGVKLNSSGYVDFTVDGDWTLECLIYNPSKDTSSYMSLYDGAATNELAQSDTVSATTSAVATFNGKAGSFRLKRNEENKKEFTIFEVKINVIKADGTYFDVNFYDGVSKISTASVLENSTIDSAVVPSPKQFFKKFVGWTNAEGQNVDLTTFTVGAEINLYAKYVDDPIENENFNNLTPAYITKAATQISSLNDGLVLTNTNYEVLSASAIMKEQTTLPNDEKTPVTNYIQLNGKVSNDKCAIKAKFTSGGKLIAYVMSGTSSSNSFVLANASAEAISTADFNASGISKVVLDVESAGTYLLGGNGGTTRIYALYFEEATPVTETVKLNYQFDNEVEKNAVRFIGTINAEDLAKVSDIKLDLTLSDGVNFETVTVAFDTVYTSITDLDGFSEAEGVYYIVLELTDLSFARGYTLNATLKVTIDGVEETATLAEAISLAIAK